MGNGVLFSTFSGTNIDTATERQVWITQPVVKVEIFLAGDQSVFDRETPRFPAPK